jgi:hypothetical protein
MTREEERREAEIARQRADDPCRYDDELRRAHPELEALGERHIQEMLQLDVQHDLDELELKADEIRARLLEPEAQVQRAVRRAELAIKISERHMAQFGALSKRHAAAWKAACDAAIAQSRKNTSASVLTKDGK